MGPVILSRNTLIGEDLGDALSRRVAQQMVLFHRRAGGQSQFSALLEMGGGDGRFAELLGWMRSHLHSRLTIKRWPTEWQ